MIAQQSKGKSPKTAKKAPKKGKRGAKKAGKQLANDLEEEYQDNSSPFDQAPSSRRKAEGLQLTDAQLKSILQEIALPKATRNAASLRYQQIAINRQDVGLHEILNMPEFSNHSLMRRLFEVIIDLIQGNGKKNNALDWRKDNGKQGRMKRGRSTKSVQFYGSTFASKGSLGLRLVADPSATSGPLGKFGVIVASVAYGKLASQDGNIQLGDTLVSVNGRSTTSMYCKQVIQLIGKVGRPLKLRFKRQSSSSSTERPLRFSVKFRQGRIGLGLKEKKRKNKETSSFYGASTINLAEISTIFVNAVAAGTQAAASICQKNDKLIAINEQDVSKWQQKQVLSFIGTTPRPIIMQFYRKSSTTFSASQSITPETASSSGSSSFVSGGGMLVDSGPIGTTNHRAMSGSAAYEMRRSGASSTQRVSLSIFLCVCAICCSHTIDPRVKDGVAFRMYDVDGDGVVSWDDLFYMLKIVTHGNVSDSQLEHMTNHALDRFDATNDGELDLKQLTLMIPVDSLLQVLSF